MSGSINIPCSNSMALQQLRIDPDKVFETDYYIVEPLGTISNLPGGSCNVECSTSAEDPRIHTLNVTVASGQGRDFFYPYIQEGRGGVGHCQVPLSVPPGTLVLTAGMNGCAMQVNLDGSFLHFYHDANEKSLSKQPVLPGRCVARVIYSMYTGRERLFANITEDLKVKAHATYLITVRLKDGWGIYASTFLLDKKTVKTFLGFGADRTEDIFTPLRLTPYRKMTSFLKKGG